MGGVDKAMLRLGGAPLLRIVQDRIAPQVEALAISANGDLGRFGNDLPVLPDTDALGPLASQQSWMLAPFWRRLWCPF
jgi:molybdopterin-guanine dinucleotide biosynthesis protein A